MKLELSVDYNLLTGTVESVTVLESSVSPDEVQYLLKSAVTLDENRKYEVWVTNAGATKIKLIKEIRFHTGCGLKEGKDMSEGLLQVRPLWSHLPYDLIYAQDLKRYLEAQGATVELRPV